MFAPVSPLTLRLWAHCSSFRDDKWREIFHVAVLLAHLVFDFNKALIKCGTGSLENFQRRRVGVRGQEPLSSGILPGAVPLVDKLDDPDVDELFLSFDADAQICTASITLANQWFELRLVSCVLEGIFKIPGEFFLDALIMTGAMAGSTSRALGMFASTPASVLLGSLISLVGQLALSSRSSRLTMDDLRLFVGRRLAFSGPAFVLTGRWTHR